MQGRREEKKPDRRNLLILLLLLLTIFAVGVTIWALFFRETQSTLAPDYAPQEEEEKPAEKPVEQMTLQEKMAGLRGIKF